MNSTQTHTEAHQGYMFSVDTFYLGQKENVVVQASNEAGAIEEVQIKFIDHFGYIPPGVLIMVDSVLN